jgi:hypothetical protein
LAGGKIALDEVVGICRNELMSQWNGTEEVKSLGKEVAQEVSLWNDDCQ